MAKKSSAEFRFYEELNDHLPRRKRRAPFAVFLGGNPPVGNVIESLGVPSTEVDLVLVNGVSVGFDHRLSDGDRVSVYPIFESLNIAPVQRVRGRPLRKVAFVLDVGLRVLASRLRRLGFDAVHIVDCGNENIVGLSVRDRRILLTRNAQLLENNVVEHAYRVRSRRPNAQLVEVLKRFDLIPERGPHRHPSRLARSDRGSRERESKGDEI